MKACQPAWGLHWLLALTHHPLTPAGGATDTEWSDAQPGTDADPERDGAEEGEGAWIWSFWHSLQGQGQVLGVGGPRGWGRCLEGCGRQFRWEGQEPEAVFGGGQLQRRRREREQAPGWGRMFGAQVMISWKAGRIQPTLFSLISSSFCPGHLDP